MGRNVADRLVRYNRDKLVLCNRKIRRALQRANRFPRRITMFGLRVKILLGLRIQEAEKCQ